MKANTLKRITWKLQDKCFGLDYSYLTGIVHDFKFDIRYDYDGNPAVKPRGCGLCLVIYYKGRRMADKFADTPNELTDYSENYLEKEINSFVKKYL